MKPETDFYLSFGTLATLTGERNYGRLHLIGNSFALWAMSCGQTFDTWMSAWNQFYTSP